MFNATNVANIGSSGYDIIEVLNQVWRHYYVFNKTILPTQLRAHYKQELVITGTVIPNAIYLVVLVVSRATKVNVV